MGGPDGPVGPPPLVHPQPLCPGPDQHVHKHRPPHPRRDVQRRVPLVVPQRQPRLFRLAAQVPQAADVVPRVRVRRRGHPRGRRGAGRAVRERVAEEDVRGGVAPVVAQLGEGAVPRAGAAGAGGAGGAEVVLLVARRVRELVVVVGDGGVDGGEGRRRCDGGRGGVRRGRGGGEPRAAAAHGGGGGGGGGICCGAAGFPDAAAVGLEQHAGCAGGAAGAGLVQRGAVFRRLEVVELGAVAQQEAQRGHAVRAGGGEQRVVPEGEERGARHGLEQRLQAGQAVRRRGQREHARQQPLCRGGVGGRSRGGPPWHRRRGARGWGGCRPPPRQPPRGGPAARRGGRRRQHLRRGGPTCAPAAGRADRLLIGDVVVVLVGRPPPPRPRAQRVCRRHHDDRRRRRARPAPRPRRADPRGRREDAPSCRPRRLHRGRHRPPASAARGGNGWRRPTRDAPADAVRGSSRRVN
ncbi:hypothetical protein DFJ74DRAFT_669501 [Hyaloraphidium curvatum]|nr:hypothetical protein DFJ74DRAFT_669501 [Hyaloraphidium curvatum]